MNLPGLVICSLWNRGSVAISIQTGNEGFRMGDRVLIEVLIIPYKDAKLFSVSL